jgi:Plasmid encoded RepA protein
MTKSSLIIADSDIEPRPRDDVGFLHSALCTMSLPIRRPADEFAPILRQDGRYSMLLQPRSYPDGQGGLVKVGVPFGAKARLVLIHIMTEAVKSANPEVYLGRSLTHWMRRLGYTSFSGGPSGTMTLFREQVRRLARCDWTIRRELDEGEGAQLTDVRISDDLLLWTGPSENFVESLRLNDRFFEHLREHAVPLSEHALYTLRENPTALDLYVWLVYRLPRLQRPTVLSWRQVAQHFGNDYRNIRQFRHELRKILPKVLNIYPEARIDMSEGLVMLSPSPPAVSKTLIAYGPTGKGTLVKTQAISASSEPKKKKKNSQKDVCPLKKALLTELAKHLEPKTLAAWFDPVVLQDSDQGLALKCPTGFQADYVAAHFRTQLELSYKRLGWGSLVITT